MDLTEKFARAYNVTLGAAWDTIGKALRGAEVMVGAEVRAEEGKLETGGQTSTSTEDYTSLAIIPRPTSTGPELEVVIPETKLSEVVIPTMNLKPEVTLMVNGSVLGEI